MGLPQTKRTHEPAVLYYTLLKNVIWLIHVNVKLHYKIVKVILFVLLFSDSFLKGNVLGLDGPYAQKVSNFKKFSLSLKLTTC